MDYRPLETDNDVQRENLNKSAQDSSFEVNDNGGFLNTIENKYKYRKEELSVKTLSEKKTSKEAIQKSTATQAAINTFRSIVGTTFLAVPYLIRILGWRLFAPIFLFALITNLYGTHMLLSVADRLGYYGASYDKLMVFVFNKKWLMYLVRAMMVISQILGVIGNNLFIIEVLLFIFCQQGLPDQYCKPRWVYVVMSFVISAPTYLIQHLSCYAYVSLASAITACCIMAVLALQSSHQLAKREIYSAANEEPRLDQIFIAFSVMYRSIQGVGMIMPIRSSMENVRSFKTVIQFTTVLVAAIYFSTFMLVYAAFGGLIKPIVLISFSKDYLVIFALTILYGLAIFLSYPINLFPIYTALLETSVFKDYIVAGEDESAQETRTKQVSYLVRLLCILTVYLGVATNPSFIPFLGLVGSIFTTAFLFFIPLFLYDSLFSTSRSYSCAHRLFNWLYGLLLLVISIIGAKDSLLNMYSHRGE